MAGNNARFQRSHLSEGEVSDLQERIAELEHAINTPLTGHWLNGDKWVGIETAPRDGNDILAYWDKSCVYAVISWHGCWLGEDDQEVSAPTHWMPLPLPPAQSDGESDHAAKTILPPESST